MFIAMILLSIFAIQTLRSFSSETIINIFKGKYIGKNILIEEILYDPETHKENIRS